LLHANFYNNVISFSTMVEKWLYTLIIFCLLCFLMSSNTKGLSLGSYHNHPWNDHEVGLLSISSISLIKVMTHLITFPLWCHELSTASLKEHSQWS
jgi:hypothetical protein